MKKTIQFIENDRFFSHLKTRFPCVNNIEYDTEDLVQPYFKFISQIDKRSSDAFLLFFNTYLVKSNIEPLKELDFQLLEDESLCLCFVYAIQFYFL